jgi:hypothetical protein
MKCPLKEGLQCPASASTILKRQCLGCSLFEKNIVQNPRVMIECDCSQIEIEWFILRHEKAIKEVVKA